jgi:hypothetical protein
VSTRSGASRQQRKVRIVALGLDALSTVLPRDDALTLIILREGLSHV